MGERRRVRVGPNVQRVDTRDRTVITLDSATIEGARSDYRAYVKAMKDQRREDARHSARIEHEHNEARLAALANVFRDRVKEPFDWQGLVASQPPPALPSFARPEPLRGEAEARTEAQLQAPVAGYYVIIVVALVIAIVGGMSFYTPPMLLAALLALLAVRDNRPRRLALADLTLRRYQSEHRQRVTTAQLQYQRDAVERESAWKAEERKRSALRTAAECGNCEPLATLLEEELSNEELPLPISFDIEFNGPHSVSVELVLPGIDVIPAQRSKLTKTGKISYRNMAKKDRRALYVNLCCGLALRLVHETYRVLPMVQNAALSGIGQGSDRQRVCALRQNTTRDAFASVRHDNLDASELLTQLGGVFACGKDGSLSQLPAE